jgi:uncharacterized protein DUF2844
MDNFRWNRLRPGGLFGALTLVASACFAFSPAWAALGGNAASITADQAHFQGSVKVTAHALFDIHELTLSTGTTVREYAAPDGTVFAIGWDGPAMPDLRQALGAHYDEFLAAAQANSGGHHHLAAQRGDLVLVSTGRMRAFAGRAYLASAVPSGVSIDELR